MTTDLKKKSRPAMTAIFKEEKNPTFLAVLHTDVTFEKEFYKGGKRLPVAFTIVDILSQGWSKVPYQSGAKTKQQNQKKLSELVTMEDGTKLMKMWTFEKTENIKDRGERVDDTFWLVQIGDTFLMWLDELRAREMKDVVVCKDNKIPALSVCEIELQSKNNEQVAKCTGVKIPSLKVSNLSLYSYMPALVKHNPKSYNEARTNALQNQVDYPSIHNDIQADRLGFFVHVDKAAIIDDEQHEETGNVHIVGWGGKDVIDIPVWVVHKYTNVTNLAQACQLLEVAIAMDSLSVYVVYNEYKRSAMESALKGIPIIDTEKMLECIDHTAISEKTVYQTPYTAVIDEVTYKIEVEVDPAPKLAITNQTHTGPLSEDLIITGLDIEIAKGYKIKFRYVSPDEEILNMFIGYFNASAPAASITIGFKRRKITLFEDSHDDN